MQSMTGFASREATVNGTHYVIELRSVNHRFIDLRFRLPAPLQPFENVFSEAVRQVFKRGSIEVSIRSKMVSLEQRTSGGVKFLVDEKAAKSLKEALKQLENTFGLPLPLSAQVLAVLGKVLIAVEENAERNELPPELSAVFHSALASLKSEREREGSETARSLQETTSELNAVVAEMRVLAPLQPGIAREKLAAKLQEAKLVGLDPIRLEQEVAIIAQKSDISEEIQRLGAHLSEYTELLQKKEPLGKRLDILTQELHRETNTISSKTDDLRLTRLAMAAKSCIEKLREQVQNVE
jgi:uncharacterized protein (TIGR00255 family)